MFNIGKTRKMEQQYIYQAQYLYLQRKNQSNKKASLQRRIGLRVAHSVIITDQINNFDFLFLRHWLPLW
jgi:hypothetical protein